LVKKNFVKNFLLKKNFVKEICKKKFLEKIIWKENLKILQNFDNLKISDLKIFIFLNIFKIFFLLKYSLFYPLQENIYNEKIF